MGNLSGESREQNRKDKVTRFRSVTYARQLGLLVNTLGSYLNSGSLACAKRARSGAPWVRKFGKLSNRENLVMTQRTPARPPAHPYTHFM